MSAYGESNTKHNEINESKNLIVVNTEIKPSNNDGTMDKKKNKVKKVKDKAITGQKRKCSDKIEFNKKVKRKKKELVSVDLNKHLSNAIEVTAENLISSDVTLARSKIGKKNKQNNCDVVELDSDVENKEIISQEKSKPVSAKKIKAVTNACKDALEVLIKLGIDVLTLMDMSLKILKSHNFLDNKLISNETLLKLIELALVSNKANEESDSNNGTSLSKIITNSYISPSPKPSKAKKNSIKDNNMMQAEVAPSEEPLPKLEPKSDEKITIEHEIIIEEEVEKEVTISVENDEKLNSVVKSGKNFCITNYFKKVEKIAEDGQKGENFNFLTPRTDMHFAQKTARELSDIRRQVLEEEMENQTSEINYLIENPPKHVSRISLKYKQVLSSPSEVEKFEKVENKIGVEPEILEKSAEGVELTLKKVTPTKVNVTDTNCGVLISKKKAKLFQFHDNRRPPYWGTWRRKSGVVTGRKPFGKDKLFNYEIDSDDEWEEEPGESLHGSDEEKEPEEDYEVDNDFFVPHGYLSDDENPEKENMSPQKKLSLLEEQFSSELNQKTKKMTPIVFGTYWENKNSPTKDSRFQDLGLGKLQYSYWVTPPIHIEEEETDKNNDTTSEQEPTSQTKKTRNKATFPETEIPNLIRMVHGSPHNSDWLAKKFLEQRDSGKIDSGKLTKICVLKKIKELANWQANSDKKMCWNVPKDVQLEFKTEVGPEKKPQKCYIWKFVRKGNKMTGLPSPIPEVTEIIDLEASTDENL